MLLAPEQSNHCCAGDIVFVEMVWKQFHCSPMNLASIMVSYDSKIKFFFSKKKHSLSVELSTVCSK